MFKLPKFVKKYNAENHKSVYYNTKNPESLTTEDKVKQNSENILNMALLLGDLINELLETVLKDRPEQASKLIKNILKRKN